MPKATTSDRLKELMTERNLKQVDILNMVKPYCEKYGEKINKSHLSQWISGINEPNQRKLTILSMALNVSEPWLIGYDVVKERNPQLKYDYVDTDFIANAMKNKETYQVLCDYFYLITRLSDENKRKLKDYQQTLLKLQEFEEQN